VTGEVELSTSDTLRELILNALDADDLHELVIDLDQVAFMDSTGIAALIAGRDAAIQRGIGYRIINPQRMVHRVLAITGTLAPLTGRDPRHPVKTAHEPAHHHHSLRPGDTHRGGRRD